MMDQQTAPSNPELNALRRGEGRPLMLLHGLGGRAASWDEILPALAASRAVIAVDLPGHGDSPVLPGAGTFRGIADALERFILDAGLEGVDVAGLSLGGRAALEMARRGRTGATVALAPGGFWNARERRYLKSSMLSGIKLARWSQRAMPFLTRHRPTRALLLAQISARPSRPPQELVLQELRSFAATPTFEELVRDLAEAPAQEGGDTPGPVTIVWGRKDRLLLPRQAEQAMQAFPQARLHWLDGCGHYIPWDAPDETVRLILDGTGEGAGARGAAAAGGGPSPSG